jgi:hypothetical protein
VAAARTFLDDGDALLAKEADQPQLRAARPPPQLARRRGAHRPPRLDDRAQALALRLVAPQLRGVAARHGTWRLVIEAPWAPALLPVAGQWRARRPNQSTHLCMAERWAAFFSASQRVSTRRLSAAGTGWRSANLGSASRPACACWLSRA